MWGHSQPFRGSLWKNVLAVARAPTDQYGQEFFCSRAEHSRQGSRPETPTGKCNQGAEAGGGAAVEGAAHLQETVAAAALLGPVRRLVRAHACNAQDPLY